MKQLCKHFTPGHHIIGLAAFKLRYDAKIITQLNQHCVVNMVQYFFYKLNNFDQTPTK